jgi:hypothetical protein
MVSVRERLHGSRSLLWPALVLFLATECWDWLLRRG